MPAPSGFENFRNVFVVVRSLPGDRLNIVNIFGLGQLALDDAARRFIDTGDEYTVFNASGLTKSNVLNVINNNIGGIASGVGSRLRFDLPLNADDDGVNHTKIFNVPVAEYDSNQDSSWNLKTPIGGISGIVFDFSWFPELTSSGGINFDLSIKELPSGQDISATNTVTATIAETKSFTANVLNTNMVNLRVNVRGLQDISLSLARNPDSLTGKVRAVSYGIIYKASGSS